MIFLKTSSIVSVFTIASAFLSHTAFAITTPENEGPKGYDYGVDIGALLKRDVSKMPTTGVRYNGSSASIPVRQEIRDLEKNGDLWQLYILAQSMMQTMDQSEMRSWYQIAGQYEFSPIIDNYLLQIRYSWQALSPI